MNINKEIIKNKDKFVGESSLEKEEHEELNNILKSNIPIYEYDGSDTFDEFGNSINKYPDYPFVNKKSPTHYHYYVKLKNGKIVEK